MNQFRNLSRAIKALAPIHGVSIGDWQDKNTWRVDFKEEATPEQIAAVEQFVNDLDPDQGLVTIDDYSRAIQRHIDTTARARQYNDGNACVSYISSTNETWAAEAQAFVAWRDDVWVYAFTELDKVQNGQREQPTVEDLIAELPVISWP